MKPQFVLICCLQSYPMLLLLRIIEYYSIRKSERVDFFYLCASADRWSSHSLSCTQFNLDHKLACYCSIQISHPVGILSAGQEKLVVTPISWLAWDSLTWRPCSPNLTCEESFVEVGKESEILTSEPLPKHCKNGENSGKRGVLPNFLG